MTYLRDPPRTSISGAVLTAVLFRATYAAVPVVAIPVGLSELGAVGFGAWVTALSTASVVAFADLGIGTGLMTKLGALDLRQPLARHEARRLVSTAYSLAAGFVAAIAIALALSARIVDWGELLNAEREHRLVEGVVLVTLFSYACNILVLLVVRVQYALGQQVRSNLWQAAGSGSMLIGLLVAPRLAEHGLAFVAMVMFAPVLVAAANSMQFFSGTVGRSIRPGIAYVSRSTGRVLLTTGARFVTVSMLMALSIAADPWIVAQAAALKAVPEFAIPYRVFALAGSIAVLMALPLWPRHAQAVARGNVDWMRSITVRMTGVCGASYLVGAVCALVWGPQLLGWLVPDLARGAHLNMAMWIGLALWWLCQVIASPAFMAQNGAEVLGPQVVGYSIVLALLPVKWLLAETFGFAIVPWVSLVVYCAVIWPACAVGFRRTIQMAETNRDRILQDDPPAREEGRAQ